MTFHEWWAAFIGADFYTKGEVAENAWMARDSLANIAEAQSAAEIAGLRAEVERLRAENETLKQRLRDLNSVFSGIEIYMPDNVKIKIDLARLACEKTTAKQ